MGKKAEFINHRGLSSLVAVSAASGPRTHDNDSFMAEWSVGMVDDFAPIPQLDRLHSCDPYYPHSGPGSHQL